MAKTESTRELILQKAENIVFSSSLDALNMRRLAKDCNLAVGTLYNFFKTKDALLSELAERVWHLAFHEDDEVFRLKDKSYVSFLEIYIGFYKRALNTVAKFDLAFSLSDLSLSNQEFKKKQNEMLDHIKQGFLLAIENDREIHEDTWTKDFTKAEFCTWLLRAAVYSLDKRDKNPKFLYQTINKLLYGGQNASNI